MKSVTIRFNKAGKFVAQVKFDDGSSRGGVFGDFDSAAAFAKSVIQAQS